MLDAMRQNLPLARARSTVMERLDLDPGGYALVTVHRAANTDDLDRLAGIVSGAEPVRRAGRLSCSPTHAAFPGKTGGVAGRECSSASNRSDTST